MIKASLKKTKEALLSRTSRLYRGDRRKKWMGKIPTQNNVLLFQQRPTTYHPILSSRRCSFSGLEDISQKTNSKPYE